MPGRSERREPLGHVQLHLPGQVDERPVGLKRRTHATALVQAQERGDQLGLRDGDRSTSCGFA